MSDRTSSLHALDRLHHSDVSEAARWGLSPKRSDELRDAVRNRITALEAENARIRIAFHDAIRRPLGATPDSGTEFYDQRMADEAEARRAGGVKL